MFQRWVLVKTVALSRWWRFWVSPVLVVGFHVVGSSYVGGRWRRWGSYRLRYHRIGVGFPVWEDRKMRCSAKFSSHNRRPGLDLARECPYLSLKLSSTAIRVSGGVRSDFGSLLYRSQIVNRCRFPVWVWWLLIMHLMLANKKKTFFANFFICHVSFLFFFSCSYISYFLFVSLDWLYFIFLPFLLYVY